MERKVVKQIQGFSTKDGAGVSLVRVLGGQTVKDFDPIVMLDSFDSRDPKQYTAGFPMHPHRGIETISYVAKGKMQHRDSMGFSDTIQDGEIQWMTAGSGILHEEQIPVSEHLLGVQLWLNLPAKDKMVSPAYYSIKKNQIPEVPFDGGKVRVLAGTYEGIEGFQGHYLPLDYYDVQLEAGKNIAVSTDKERHVMVFTLVGDAMISGTYVPEKTAARLSEGEEIRIENNGQQMAQVLVISSCALKEPVVWGGPIVMNTKNELEEAYRELSDGTFLKETTSYSNES